MTKLTYLQSTMSKDQYKATEHFSTTRIFLTKDECFVLDIV